MMRRSYNAVPDNPTGFPLNPCREWASLIAPETTTNLFTNPSFETNTSGWTVSGGVGSALARSSTYQYKGAYSGAVTSGLAVVDYTQVVGPAVVSGTLYTISFHVRKVNKGSITSSDVKSYVNGTAINFDTIEYVGDGWFRCIKTFQATATTAPGIRVYSIGGTGGTAQILYVDAAQLESKGYVTTYCDGDQLGLLPVGLEPAPYYWTGTPHGSTSVRAATTRAGGRELILNRYGFTLLGTIGLGLAPRNNVSTELGLLDGSLYQTTIREKRPFTLAGSFEAKNADSLSKLRGNLRAALQHDLTGVKQPSVITLQRYDGLQAIGQRALLPIGYTDGLEGNEQQVFNEKVAVKFEQYQPGLIASADRGTSGAGAVSVSNANYIIQQSAGAWAALGSGMNGEVRCAAIGPDGKLYVGGTFTTAGGGSANNIAVWDGSTWAALGTGLGSTCHAIAFDTSGNLYAGGAFTTAGGSGANRVAMWNGSAWSALGTGLNDVCYTLIYLNGSLIVGGAFTTAGGSGANRIAYWVPSTWTNVGTGFNNICYTLAALGSSVHAGGDFTTAGGNSAARVCLVGTFTTTTVTAIYSALGAGVNNTCYTLAFDTSGNLYAGGLFTTAGTITTNFIAVWNGTAWAALGSGLTGTSVRSLWYSIRDRVLYVGGLFTAAGSVTFNDGFAIWNGSAWFAPTVNLPGTPTVYAIAQSVTVLYVGYSTSGTATGNATATLTNPGTMPAPLTIAISYTSATVVTALFNYTTGKAVYFSLTTQASERVVISYLAGTLRVTSPNRGTITGAILSTSDPDAFLLIPGSNTIGILTNQTSATIDYWFTPLYDDFDGLTGK